MKWNKRRYFHIKLNFSPEWEWTGLGCTAIPSRSVMGAEQALRNPSVHKNHFNIIESPMDSPSDIKLMRTDTTL